MTVRTFLLSSRFSPPAGVAVKVAETSKGPGRLLGSLFENAKSLYVYSMSEMKPDKPSFSFRHFLEGNTNLLTIFAISNALIAFSISIKENEIVRDVLTISFWVLSFLVFFEILIETYKTLVENRTSISGVAQIKLSLFLYAVVFSQLALVAYFTILYPYVVGWVLIFSATVTTFLLMMWVKLTLDDRIRKLIEKGWSGRTVKILRRINTWLVFAVLLSLLMFIVYLKHLRA